MGRQAESRFQSRRRRTSPRGFSGDCDRSSPESSGDGGKGDGTKAGGRSAGGRGPAARRGRAAEPAEVGEGVGVGAAASDHERRGGSA
jgi:hypothetical protein